MTSRLMYNVWKKKGIIKVFEGLPNFLRVFREVNCTPKTVQNLRVNPWKCQLFLDTKLSGFYEFCFSNSDGETYPRAECIRFVL